MGDGRGAMGESLEAFGVFVGGQTVGQQTEIEPMA
jgi:hypothetical protein